jgi:hypothetical protein
MKAWPAEDRRLVEYLLGRLPPDDQAELEERVFVDDGFEEQLEATADDLIHAYLEGTLSGEDRAGFEAHFLSSPRHRERLAFVKDLQKAIEGTARETRAPAASRPAWGLWIAAALLAAAAVAFLLRPEPEGPRLVDTSPSPTSTPTPRASPQETPRPNPSPTPSGRRDKEAVVRLARGGDAGPVDVRLPASVRLVRVEVPVDEEGPAAYDAVLRDAKGSAIWRAGGVSPASEGGPLVLDIPARLLASGDYALELAGEQLRDPSTPPSPKQFTLRVLREP